ncbi:hypothetical protein [Streptomyces sp. NRRL F-525]|nr:hypothetical protein [Streptomyces sp. NRRL F-525]
MDLRPELVPPSVPVVRVEQLAREIRRIEHPEQIVDAELAYRPIVL